MVTPMGTAAVDGFAAWARHVNPPQASVLRMLAREHRIVRAEGNRLHCASGRVFTDWIAGFGSLALGHRPAAPMRALQEHLASGAPTLLVDGAQPEAGRLGRRLVELAGAGFETCHFTNSGSEAVETALKLAIAATGRHEVAYCRGGYHGITLGALGLMEAGDFRDPFEPALRRWRAVDLNDEAGLQTALADRRCAALVIEPIQVESGVRACSEAFLRAARAQCDATGTLLVFDEVQTGLGRTGSVFRFQQGPVVPDVLALAKALGAGLVPIGATLAREGLVQAAFGGYRRAAIHQSTYGGNALACTVGLAAVEQLADAQLLAQVGQASRRLQALAERELAPHPQVQRVQWHGLLGVVQLRGSSHPWFAGEALGLEPGDERPVSGPLMAHRLYRRHLLLQPCGHDWRCLRLQPPLQLPDDDADALVEALRAELDRLQDHE